MNKWFLLSIPANLAEKCEGVSKANYMRLAGAAGEIAAMRSRVGLGLAWFARLYWGAGVWLGI